MFTSLWRGLTGEWLSVATRERFLEGRSLDDGPGTDERRNVPSEIILRSPVLGLPLGSSSASKLEGDARSVLIKFVTDTKLERMANVVADKNMSQHDWDVLEYWVKNNKVAFQRDKCKILFGSYKSMAMMGGKKLLVSGSGREKALRFCLTKSSIEAAKSDEATKNCINGTIMY